MKVLRRRKDEKEKRKKKLVLQYSQVIHFHYQLAILKTING